MSVIVRGMQNSIWRAYLLCLLLSMCLFLAVPTRAAEPQENTAETTSTEQQARASQQPTDKRPPASNTDSTFRPSEEVSEDLSVPFPVDI